MLGPGKVVAGPGESVPEAEARPSATHAVPSLPHLLAASAQGRWSFYNIPYLQFACSAF